MQRLYISAAPILRLTSLNKTNKYREFRLPSHPRADGCQSSWEIPTYSISRLVHSKVEEFLFSSPNRRLYPGGKKRQITFQ